MFRPIFSIFRQWRFARGSWRNTGGEISTWQCMPAYLLVAVATATCTPNMSGSAPFLATNAFYYYADVPAAESFYNDIFGFETVSDFGFAKILQVGPSSFLTLVDADSGMHTADEPKSVTLALVTENVELWYDHLTSRDVPMRAELRVTDGSAHDGFVAIDPEGYFLEVERFNPHEENDNLLPMLESVQPLVSTVGNGRLTTIGTVLWLYYDQLAPIQTFYETAVGLDMVVDQGWAKVYRTSRTGFIGFVDGARGLHNATQENGVTISFLTDDIESWFERMQNQPNFEFRTRELGDESGRVRTFVGYDPHGYFLEWDEFLAREGNERLIEVLDGQAGGT